MIVNSEIKKKNSEEIRVIFYDENGNSTGFLFNSQSLYKLYDQLRNFYNNQEVENEI